MEVEPIASDSVPTTKPEEVSAEPDVAVEAVAEDDSPKEQTPVKPAKEDEYAYLDSTGFTSEKFKIEVRNLPKYYGIAVSRIVVHAYLKPRYNEPKISWFQVCVWWS